MGGMGWGGVVGGWMVEWAWGGGGSLGEPGGCVKVSNGATDGPINPAQKDKPYRYI